MHQCPKCGKKLTRNGHTPSGKQRWVCRARSGADRSSGGFCYTTTTPTSKSVLAQDGTQRRSQKTPVFERELGGEDVFIITAAQNATPAHAGFVRALEALAQDQNGDILAVPIRYKNPTSTWSKSQRNEDTWSDRIKRYLWSRRLRLNSNITLLGDVKIQLTATSPLTGMEGFTGGESSIVAHSKLQLRSVATPQNRMAKIMTTTGACTVKNYTDSKAGKLGNFHHNLGAALVKIRGKRFHLRQLNATYDGAFIDLGKHYLPNGTVVKAPRPLALVMGDTHVRVVDPLVVKATFGAGGIVDTLDPEVLVWHDLLDAESISHHHKHNPFMAVHKRANGKDNALEEVKEALAFLEEHTRGRQSVIVDSNHNDMLHKWLMYSDWRQDPTNAEFYLESALALVRLAKQHNVQPEQLSAFPILGQRMLAHRPDIRFLMPNEQYSLAQILLSMHGHFGTNGSRGSLRGLIKIGARFVIGHVHNAGIEEGGMSVGTSSILLPGYVRGPNAWTQSHGLIHANSKRQLIHIIDGDPGL